MSSSKLIREIAKRMKKCFPGASCSNCGSGSSGSSGEYYLEQTLIVCFIKQSIVGMVLVIKGKGGYEIYSLCDSEDYRNKSICNNLVLKALNTIQKDEGKKVTIWIALEPLFKFRQNRN